MTGSVTTALGDRVAVDIRGSGPALVFVAGAGPYRAIDPITNATAELCAARGVTSVVYDRVGRGESRVDGRIDLDREMAAVSAVIEAAGGQAVLCGHSSGCAISLAAAVRGLPVTGLVLWEAPLDPHEEVERVEDWTAEFGRRVDAGDLEGALAHYMRDIPPEFLEAWRASPEYSDLVAQVGSLRPDCEALLWAASTPLDELLADVRVPVQALFGEQTFPGMVEAARAVAAAVPGATHGAAPGAHHTWEPEAMAETLARFVLRAPARASR